MKNKIYSTDKTLQETNENVQSIMKKLCLVYNFWNNTILLKFAKRCSINFTLVKKLSIPWKKRV